MKGGLLLLNFILSVYDGHFFAFVLFDESRLMRYARY